ncbi:phosphoadenosine phosphosulfate reductase family protein [Bacteroides uniformis]|uniref:Phosphoadenosine phosphosulfate reductase family protein n=1 Tax=Bacteroides uniformis TaxID=820 RepID=A0ABS5X3R7_BACUN|nr:phosphoadenosine phosphosulfate reductase family protein [Phocaeicola dorei]MBT1296398.1 phosphoadenosine phosphosulfate reductase family protein [Phocaeicola dorei]MBT1305303.1 phosphoadenosine phosphosulfate reductase family protein [Phocaeicola dorei]MBT8726587.1 phosphoadenosine phosphosulfate reductase family protein [Bacteroides uniformis]
MYKIEWDKETGGILLSSKVTKETLGVSPRPVWFEELDLLGLDKLEYIYPPAEAPLMWAVNKQYFYRGELMFEAKGANIYDAPTVVFQEGKETATLVPVDIEEMLRRNKDQMFLIENEALEFIRDTYIAYAGVNRAYDAIMANQNIDFEALAQKVEKKTKQKMAVVKEDCDSFDVMPLDVANVKGKRVLLSTRIDKFIASFSGGKDSQVVLDLVTRAIPPTAFEVIYSDTGYELPSSLELYEEVKRYYGNRFPALKFTTTRNHESVLNYWDKIGTPSDTHRWCCSVMKTAPLYRSLKMEGNKQARVLTFDGVRAEESTRRSGYNRIGKGVKHSTVVNVSPILNWNSVEIFLYIFKYDLPINIAYRKGITRVGCVICPFSSEWNDMVVNRTFKSALSPFLKKIENCVNKLTISDQDEYIKSGNWKRRAGGREMNPDSALNVISTNPDLIIEMVNPHKDITTWFSAIGEFKGNSKYGNIKYGGSIYSFHVENKNRKLIIIFPNANNALFAGLVKRALYKAVFCINCEACEVECPTGALSIIPEAKINKSKCIHCQKCLNFHELGCIVAHSLKITNSKSTKMKLVGYNNFGLKEEWLDYYMLNHKDFFKSNDHGLNTKEQLPSFTKWLVHAEILDNSKTKNLTEIGKLLISIYSFNPSLVWEIIWINFTYSSPILSWYAQSVPFLKKTADAELKAMVKNDFPDTSDTTIKNIVYAMLRTLKESPIGEDICQYTSEEKQTFVRLPASEISREAIAYSLYRYSEINNSKELRVSTIYSDTEHGPKVEFGIERSILMRNLRSLSSDTDRVLLAELNMGLDHITLRKDLNAISALELLTK